MIQSQVSNLAKLMLFLSSFVLDLCSILVVNLEEMFTSDLDAILLCLRYNDNLSPQDVQNIESLNKCDRKRYKYLHQNEVSISSSGNIKLQS